MKEEKSTKRFLVAIPKPRPIKVEIGQSTVGELLSRALLTRIEGRTEKALEKHKDEDFMEGVCSVYGLIHAKQILDQLRACNVVQLEIQEESL